MDLGTSSNVNVCSAWDIPMNDQQLYLDKLVEKFERKNEPQNSSMSKSLCRIAQQQLQTETTTDFLGDVDPEDLDTRPLMPNMDRSDGSAVLTNGRTAFLTRCCDKVTLFLYRLYAFL